MKTRNLLLMSLLICLASCNNNSKFTISGVISDAENETLYIEHTTLTKTVVLDSVKLKASGNFKFKAARPEYPDLYRLRMGKQQFILPIDSCEHVQIQAASGNLAFPDTIINSYKAQEINKLRQSVVNLQRTYNQTIKNEQDINVLQAQITAHKQMAQKIILEDPRSIVAYYALFQKVGNYFLFSPYDKADQPYYKSVATAYHTFMPNYNRSKNLYNLVLDAIKAERQEQQNAYLQDLIENTESTQLDIELKNNYGKLCKLSDLKGKVVLLDFSAYEVEKSIAYTFELRELYNNFAAQGFEIYQVSADRNQLLWEEAVENLPWICVRGNGAYEDCFASYNVQAIPTTFLLDKNGIAVGRNIAFDKLPAEINKLLK